MTGCVGGLYFCSSLHGFLNQDPTQHKIVAHRRGRTKLSYCLKPVSVKPQGTSDFKPWPYCDSHVRRSLESSNAVVLGDF